ncbi:hypothetical protein NDU88_010685 [Pleurodeles waltl]|uniref:Secreted protein n=1 Tax=Pleurodeles waltl TaxID=8319 RepID=A0AAV7QYL9_PLEWA|nr:hypothetical protein NDU88_010685 [Pleurodeles waltl]
MVPVGALGFLGLPICPLLQWEESLDVGRPSGPSTSVATRWDDAWERFSSSQISSSHRVIEDPTSYFLRFMPLVPHHVNDA